MLCESSDVGVLEVEEQLWTISGPGMCAQNGQYLQRSLKGASGLRRPGLHKTTLEGSVGDNVLGRRGAGTPDGCGAISRHNVLGQPRESGKCRLESDT